MLEEGQEPTKPFECVRAHLLIIGGKEYLAYVDRLSGWPVVHSFNKADISTADVTKPIRRTFMDYGIPKVFETDNGLQFSVRWISIFSQRMKNKMEFVFTLLPSI